MQRMLHTLRQALGHPVETTLQLLEGTWKSGVLANLKERQLPHQEIPKDEIELKTRARGSIESPSAEARHVMQLYVVAHGIAAEGGEGIPDEWRALTDKGRRRFQKTARAFGKLGRKLDLILTSPSIRAVQTAEILAGETRQGEVAVLPELQPKFGADAARTAIAARAGAAQAVAIVGHQPQLSSVLGALSGVGQAEIELEEGAIVRVDLSTLADGGTADPRWWLKPKGTRKKGLPLRKQAEEKGSQKTP